MGNLTEELLLNLSVVICSPKTRVTGLLLGARARERESEERGERGGDRGERREERGVWDGVRVEGYVGWHGYHGDAAEPRPYRQ